MLMVDIHNYTTLGLYSSPCTYFRSYRRTLVWLSVWLSIASTTLLQGFGRQIVSEYRVFRQLLVTSIRRDVGYSYQSQDALGRGNNGQ